METNLNEIIICAAQNKQLDGFGDLADIHLHTILRQLYSDAAAGTVTKEDGAKLKEQYIAAWKSDKETLKRYDEQVKDWNDRIRRAETTGKQLHKAKTLRKFAADAAVILESVIGETGLLKMVGELQ